MEIYNIFKVDSMNYYTSLDFYGHQDPSSDPRMMNYLPQGYSNQNLMNQMPMHSRPYLDYCRVYCANLVLINQVYFLL